MQSTRSHVVLRVALPVPLRQLFDYLPAETAMKPQPGMRALLPFGHRKMLGVIVEISNKSDMPFEKLVRATSYPDDGQTVLTNETMELLRWCWRYYKHAPREVVFNALPPMLRKASGSIPPPPVQYRLTAAGEEHLQLAPGRIRAQFRMLGEIRGGAATA